MTAWPPSLRNLHAFVEAMCFTHVKPGEPWPCYQCEGRGSIYAPGSRPCPIEGNKMRDRVACPSCGGSKIGPRAPWTAALKEARSAHAAEARRVDRRRIPLLRGVGAEAVTQERRLLAKQMSGRQTQFLQDVIAKANIAAKEFLALPESKTANINNADFRARSAALGVNDYGEEFLLVFFEEGYDLETKAWIERRLMLDFPRMLISCLLEW